MNVIRELTTPHAPDSPLIRALTHVFRAARQRDLPFTLTLHTEDEDRHFLSQKVLPHQTVFTAEVDDTLAGFISFSDDGQIHHLYVAPEFQRRGLGSKLLALPQSMFPTLHLWAFTCNTPAIAFYQRHGFRIIEESDGATNEAKMPDVRMQWTAAEAPL